MTGSTFTPAHGLAKRKLAKFNGCVSQIFMLRLEVCEFHFNHRKENIHNIIKNLLKKP
jgi:transposase-like protein